MVNVFLLLATYQKHSYLDPGKKKNSSALLGELQSVHLEKNTRDEDGREGFESSSGTAKDHICVKQVGRRPPVTKKEMMPNFRFGMMLAKG